jgi:transposase-like protein
MLFDAKGHSFERDIIMLNVRWYLSYKLSYRDLEEMAVERLLFNGCMIPRESSQFLTQS